MVSCLLNELDTSAVEEAVVANEDGVRRLACKCGKCRIDLPAGADALNLNLQSHGAGSRWCVSFHRLDTRSIGRIDEAGDTSSLGYQLMQQFQLLGHQFPIEKIDSRQVAARPGEVCDKTEPDRVFGNDEEDRNRRGCRLCSKDGGSIPTSLHHGDPPAHQIG